MCLLLGSLLVMFGYSRGDKMHERELGGQTTPLGCLSQRERRLSLKEDVNLYYCHSGVFSQRELAYIQYGTVQYLIALAKG